MPHVDPPNGAAARLAWIAEQLAIERTLEEIADALGWDVFTLRLAINRHGLDGIHLPAPEPPPVASADLVKLDPRLARPDVLILLPTLLQCAELRNIKTGREALRERIIDVAHARGKAALRWALISLAASALRWAHFLSDDGARGDRQAA